MGSSHPLAPPIGLRGAGGYVVGEVTYGTQFEGPPGCVHGGFIAAAFDDILGAAQTLSCLAGVTGTLAVRYRSPRRSASCSGTRPTSRPATAAS